MRIIVYLFIMLLCGCAKITHLNELLTLKGLADNQKQIETYLQKQERGFTKLNDDIKNDRLTKGELKRYIIAKYSEPVLTKEVDDGGGIKEILLYRHPTKYFKSDRIYLYFDAGHRLVSWQLKPVES